ncbi:MAG TPA: hypothetical protein PKK01_06870 [Mycobacterium sp.]|nr:hypothetical protein [Mycobacterium sp.]HPZ94685.1 hypothetical protein [Mycobacterium sp.]
MTCCILGLMLMAAIGRVRRMFGRQVPAADLFAPVARRPAPGEVWPVVPIEVLPPVPIGGAPRRSAVLGYCALGIVVVLVGAPALVATGLLTNTGSAGQWLLRSACYVAAVVTALVLRRSTALWRAPSGVGPALVILGTIIFELGVLDMHIFRVIAVDNSNMLQMFAFHNVGPALAIIGGVVLGYGSLGRTSSSWRPSRSILTSAQPSSSAVTMVSTPPLTS